MMKDCLRRTYSGTMKPRLGAALVIAATIITHTTIAPSVEQENPLRLSVAPLSLDLNQGELLTAGSRIELQSLDPQGNLHPVTDLHGQGQWSVETLQDGRMFQIVPSPQSYAGPLQVKVDGKVVSRYGELDMSSVNLILEKVLSDRTTDGTLLKIHYTDFTLEKSKDPTYPQRVLTHMKEAYEVLSRDLKLDQNPQARTKVIEAYIGDTESEEPMLLGGYTLSDYKRAPLLMIREDETGESKTPVLLMPADYKKFLSFWNDINHVPQNPAGREYTDDQYLATSVMHEMTHAVIHGFNDNLGSTEHELRDGDWYTEGLARYFECKAGSDAGFASEGFRKIVAGRVQFSRGGANYYLRYPDEKFFSMRYENALFWMYVEKTYGLDTIVMISRALKKYSYEATTADYSRVLAETTGLSFGDLLNDYFNWVYRRGYRGYAEGAKLLPVATTRSVWSAGQFHVYKANGELAFSESDLKTDWIASWGEAVSESTSDVVSGDWSRGTDVQPLAFDAHQILLSAAPAEKRTVTVLNTGDTDDLRVTLYFESKKDIRTETLRVQAHQSGRFHIAAHEKVTRIGAVLANLDPDQPATYQITIE